MAKFRFNVESIDMLYIDIEANDENEARGVYESLDGSEFHYHGSDWEVTSIEKLNDDAEVDFKAGEDNE